MIAATATTKDFPYSEVAFRSFGSGKLWPPSLRNNAARSPGPQWSPRVTCRGAGKRMAPPHSNNTNFDFDLVSRAPINARLLRDAVGHWGKMHFCTAINARIDCLVNIFNIRKRAVVDFNA